MALVGSSTRVEGLLEARPGRHTRFPMVPLSARAWLLKHHSLLVSPMSVSRVKEGLDGSSSVSAHPSTSSMDHDDSPSYSLGHCRGGATPARAPHVHHGGTHCYKKNELPQAGYDCRIDSFCHLRICCLTASPS